MPGCCKRTGLCGCGRCDRCAASSLAEFCSGWSCRGCARGRSGRSSFSGRSRNELGLSCEAAAAGVIGATGATGSDPASSGSSCGESEAGISSCRGSSQGWQPAASDPAAPPWPPSTTKSGMAHCNSLASTAPGHAYSDGEAGAESCSSSCRSRSSSRAICVDVSSDTMRCWTGVACTSVVEGGTPAAAQPPQWSKLWFRGVGVDSAPVAAPPPFGRARTLPPPSGDAEVSTSSSSSMPSAAIWVLDSSTA